jgi:HpiC1 cyclase
MKSLKALASFNILSAAIVGVIGLMGTVVTPTMAVAVPVSIINPSFEDDVLAAGVLCGPSTGCISSPWVEGNDTGLYRPTGDHATDGFLDPVPNGANVAFSNQANISQVLGAVLLPNMIYTLTVDVGAWISAPNVFPPNPSIQLWIWNGTTSILLGSAPVSAPPGYFNPMSLVVVTDAFTPGLGDQIQIILSHGVLQNPGEFSQVWWDNVRLDASPAGVVPLPAALPLFASGLGVMGLLGWRRRRKKAAA